MNMTILTGFCLKIKWRDRKAENLNLSRRLTSKDIKIIFMGTPDFAVPSLRSLIKSGFEIIAVVTQTDKPVGRKMQLQSPPVKLTAIENNIKVMQPERAGSEDFYNELKKLNPDLIVTAAYGKILPESILNIPTFGALNVHASILPSYRGAAPIQWCLFNGDEKSGVTFMEMDKGMDTGAIIEIREIPVPEEMNAGELTEKLSETGAEFLPDIILKYCNREIKTIPQDESKASVIRPLKKEDCKIDWNRPADVVHNHIRGCNPFPGAFSFYKGKRMKISSSKISKEFSTLSQSNRTKPKPGSIILTDEKCRLFIMCSDYPIEITGLQMEGCKKMDATQCAHNFDVCEIVGG